MSIIRLVQGNMGHTVPRILFIDAIRRDFSALVGLRFRFGRIAFSLEGFAPVIATGRVLSEPLRGCILLFVRLIAAAVPLNSTISISPGDDNSTGSKGVRCSGRFADLVIEVWA